MIDTPCESKINTVVEVNFSLENRYSGIVVNDEVLKYYQYLLKPSKKIEIVEEVFLREPFSLNDSVMQKNQGDQTQFSLEKDS